MKLIRRLDSSGLRFCRVAGLGVLLAVVWLGVLARAQEVNPTRPQTAAGQAAPPPATQIAPQPAAQDMGQPDETLAAEDVLGTNGMAQVEDITPDEEPASTNGAPASTSTAPAGETRISGREARQRRFRRGANQAGANSFGSSDSALGTNGGPASLDYSAFRMVADRNIFNPNRYPRSGPRTGPAPPPREYLTLVGTMSYEKGTFAFFSGTSSKVLKLADSIAGFKVTKISADAVKLASGTNEIELRMGMQLRREEDGPWVPSRGSVSYAANSAPSTSSSTDAASTGSESDIIKKLMLKREQE